MFDFNKVNTDIENNQSLEDISKYVIWDTMLMSEKLKYLFGINNFSAIMSHGKILKVDSPNKISICINIYKAVREKQYDLLSTMYYKMYYFGKLIDGNTDTNKNTRNHIFKIFDAVTIKYTYSEENSDIRTTTYEIIETDYEKLKINLFDTQTFLKN